MILPFFSYLHLLDRNQDFDDEDTVALRESLANLKKLEEIHLNLEYLSYPNKITKDSNNKIGYNGVLAI